LIQPKVNNERLKAGLGRFLPPMPSIAKNDPFWLDPKDPHVVAYTQQGLLGPTVPNFWVFNPAVAQVQNEHVWSVGWTDVMQGDNARDRRREGVQADRRDLREISNRAGLSGIESGTMRDSHPEGRDGAFL
jgi:ABC-type glycerol-3-phosphate transport system substrate-binding protein